VEQPSVPESPQAPARPAKPKAAAKPKAPPKPTAPPKPKAPAKPKAAPKPRAPRRTAGATPVPAVSEAKTAPAKTNALRIVMVASEAHPFAKTGGLAEVLGALPVALAGLGHDVTVILPRYRGIDISGSPTTPHAFPLAGRTVRVAYVEKPIEGGVTAVLVDAPELYDREGLYGSNGQDFPDNGWRFAVLARAALEYARLKQVRPSVFHLHDWQAGLVPVYQKMAFSQDPYVGGVPCIFTIHNLAFQGVFNTAALPALGLGPEVLHINALEYWGQVSFLKGGINFSEKLTTVSPTYAREILMPEFGFGMQGVLQRRADDLVGILNGIDTQRWDPANDAFVTARFSADRLEGKRDATSQLLQHVALPVADGDRQRPVVGLISRLTDQKGFDLIAAAAEQLMSLDVTWVMLGSGEPHYEQLWQRLAARHPKRVSATIGFDERLAHMIEAGADMFLMPSRFEPCGLNQMYSLRYGTVPVVRATGGLADTVTDAAEPGGNGFKFSDYNPGAMVAAVKRALDAFDDPAAWSALQRNGMRRDFSWDVSAREYVKVYRSSISEDVNGI
jgi:starch synthase